jgi:hypothetical protein
VRAGFRRIEYRSEVSKRQDPLKCEKRKEREEKRGNEARYRNLFYPGIKSSENYQDILQTDIIYRLDRIIKSE